MAAFQTPSVALIDSDLWCYDLAFAAQGKDEEGELFVRPFHSCQHHAEDRLEEVFKATGCTSAEFFLTGKSNFRYDIATIAPYKGNRTQDKPAHYQNMFNWLQFRYGALVVQGMEADDMLAIRQTQLGNKSVIVSRDKDLRMVEGWHYGYPLSNQAEKPLEHISKLGYLTLSEKGKLTGGGLRWFYAQCLMGDRTDNIKGIPKIGDAKAYYILQDATDEKELYEATLEAYQAYYVDAKVAYDSMYENARLVWMVLETEDSKPKMWEMLT